MSDKKADLEDKKYSLYTEKIVKKPSVKYKDVIKTVKVLVWAALFGVVASFVMAWLYPWLSDKYEERHREELKIMVSDQPEVSGSEAGLNVTTNENQSASVDDDDQAVDSQAYAADYLTMRSQLRDTTKNLQKSIVKLELYDQDVGDFVTETQRPFETVGIVIGDVNSRYMILTSSTAIENKAHIMVKFSDSTQAEAAVVGSDKTMGIAVLSVDKSAIPSYYDNNVVTVAKFDNSYKIEQGDMVIAAGKLYGKAKAVDYGTVTNIDIINRVDNEYRVINTGMTYSKGDYGFIFNTAGNVVGVIYDDNNDGTNGVNAIGISSLKPLIENISNGVKSIYLGVTGENVTGTLSASYGLPMGIYVMQVEVDSPAYKAGLQTGDVITAINGNMSLTIQAFSEKLYQCDVGQKISITAKRKGKDGYTDITFDVELGSK